VTHASSWRASRTLSAREALGFAEMRERSRIGLACEIVAQILAERYSVAQMPGVYAPGDTLAALQFKDMGVQAWVGTVLRVASIPDGQALETDRGRFTVDRHGEGKNVVPIDEAIAHEFMARGDGRSSSRQRVIIRCRMIFTAI
jgi:hypothetical protein